MFSSNIEFKNFSIKKNNSKIKKILNELLGNYSGIYRELFRNYWGIIKDNLDKVENLDILDNLDNLDNFR